MGYVRVRLGRTSDSQATDAHVDDGHNRRNVLAIGHLVALHLPVAVVLRTTALRRPHPTLHEAGDSEGQAPHRRERYVERVTVRDQDGCTMQWSR